MRYIFDLDHTVICSRHRQATLPCGSLDLAHWKENSTPEKVMADSLLPLADMMRDLFWDGHEIVVCTARVMATADYQFLAKNNLYYSRMLSRPDGVTLGDGVLKEYLLRQYAAELDISFARFAKTSVMFDDNNVVIEHLQPFGLSVYNAISVNKSLAKAS